MLPHQVLAGGDVDGGGLGWCRGQELSRTKQSGHRGQGAALAEEMAASGGEFGLGFPGGTSSRRDMERSCRRGQELYQKISIGGEIVTCRDASIWRGNRKKKRNPQSKL